VACDHKRIVADLRRILGKRRGGVRSFDNLHSSISFPPIKTRLRSLSQASTRFGPTRRECLLPMPSRPPPCRTSRVTGPAVMTFHLNPARPPAPVNAIVRPLVSL
jgi:hypothetical protein